MSSATSIEGSADLKTEAAQPDAGFKPWHFFVLVSLAAATVAVLMSRRASPEHLILLSFTIGAAGVAAAAFYRMLAPLALRDASMLSERPSERALAALEREKALVLRSIKELEFDRAMGKVSPKDFDEMAGRLRARALMLMKQIDAGGSGYRELIERELQARLNSRRAGSSDPATARSDRLSPDSALGASSRSRRSAAREGGQGYGESADQPPPKATAVRRSSAKAEASAKADRAVRDPAPRDPGTDGSLDPATEARACLACGTSNDHDAVFCKKCGKSLTVLIQ